MSEYIVDYELIPLKWRDGFGLSDVDLTEEIVRCRDCAKWHHIDTEDGVRYGECDEWKRADSYCVPATNEDGFCAWAYRKEVDNAD